MTDNSAVLVTGGAGYIGSHAVLAFREAGYSVIVLDDLSTGQRSLVPADVPLLIGDVGNRKFVGRLIRTRGIRTVVHFAGSIIIPESVADPLKYYRNNTCATRNLIQTCVENGVKYFVFSSSAAVYGAPKRTPVSESAPTSPVNPYGFSKLMTEWILRDTAAAYDFSYASLRYFNVAGADPAGRTGQSTPNATHLIKVASQVAVGLRDHIELYGDSYATPDGTCVRDYIHVTDLAQAHVDALQHVSTTNRSLVLNCGYGRGYSVREVLVAVEREGKCRLNIRIAPRRPGDPPILVADPSKIREAFSWEPKYDNLNVIIRTAIEWEKKLARQRGTGMLLPPLQE
jgi:UDP-glucose 4-epimerase